MSVLLAPTSTTTKLMHKLFSKRLNPWISNRLEPKQAIELFYGTLNRWWMQNSILPRSGGLSCYRRSTTFWAERFQARFYPQRSTEEILLEMGRSWDEIQPQEIPLVCVCLTRRRLVLSRLAVCTTVLPLAPRAEYRCWSEKTKRISI